MTKTYKDSFTTKHHTMILCDHSIHEFYDVLKREVPHALPDVDILLAEVSKADKHYTISRK